jgi:MFS family permease
MTGAAAAIVVLMTLGEELWKRFLPKYLQALGAPAVAIGLYGSTRDLLDGLYQYPGGWLADRFGRRAALRVFIALAAAGYGLLLIAPAGVFEPAWVVALPAVALVMAWSSMASPTLFAVIGDALPPAQRTMGFSVQSVLRRVPIALAPTIGGTLIVAWGTIKGVQAGLVAAIAVAGIAWIVTGAIPATFLPPAPAVTIVGVWRTLPSTLRRLLVSDILVRTCESMVDVFVVLYALDHVGVSAAEFGSLITIQMAVAIAGYFPAAALRRRVGAKPLVIATFLAFALFPLALVGATTYAGLAVAFAVAGLREFGEPARKALIVDLVTPALRARSVGLYYLTRSLTIAPAALVGGLLWGVSPALPFVVAAAIGLTGAALFALRGPAAAAA